MEPSLCRWTLSGMLGFYSCSQHLLRLTLDPSPSIVHLFRRWNPTMILTMVIISTMTIICIIRHKTYYDDYSYYNCFSLIIAIIAIILIICFRLAGICGLSSTIRARLQETCSLRHPHSEHSGETCSWCLLETPEPFCTTYATSFRAHPATAGRGPATDAGCGLSTRGHWDGPVICNEWKGG